MIVPEVLLGPGGLNVNPAHKLSLLAETLRRRPECAMHVKLTLQRPALRERDG